MTGVPLYIQAAPLDPAFTGTPQAFFDALIRRMRIVSPDGFYGVVVSDTEPSSNQGIWLRDGTKIYVWDNTERKYVPADITDSLRDVYTAITSLISRITTLEGKLASGRIIYSPTAPAEADRVNVLWVQVDPDNRVLEIKSWDATTSTWVPATIDANYELTGGVVNAYTIRLNAPNSMAELVGRHLSVKFHVGCSAPSTLQVIGFDPAPLKKRKDEDLETGDFKSNQIVSVWFDGQVFQLQSSKAAVIPPIPVTPNCEYKVIIIPIFANTAGSPGFSDPLSTCFTEMPHGMVGPPTNIRARLVSLVYLQGLGIKQLGTAFGGSNVVDIYPGSHIPIENLAAVTMRYTTHFGGPAGGVSWDQTRVCVLHGVPGLTSLQGGGTGDLDFGGIGNDDLSIAPNAGRTATFLVAGTPRGDGNPHVGIVTSLGVTAGTGWVVTDPIFNLVIECFRFYT